jgi:sarcosine oxidase subunit alpha
MTAWRLDTGGRIDRSKPIRFSFDGRDYTGFSGDTLASALLANGVHLVGRSFKYHRPRGILTAGSEEPNALVTVRRDVARCAPNLRATEVEIFEGLEAHSQNRWPSLHFDTGAVRELFSPLLSAGFYYKTFMWPRRAWHALYEPRIRASAGLGVAPTRPDPDRYAQRYAHCDVLVVGAGPSGLATALAAAGRGARVILCDEHPEFGGSLLDDREARIAGVTAAKWLAETQRVLEEMPHVTLLRRTTAFGYFPHNLIGLNERMGDHLADPGQRARERLLQVRAREVVLATGAIERPLVFPGNDRPGVMLAGAARTYLNRHAVRAGACAVVVTSHDAAYPAALDLHRAGVRIAVIADVRQDAAGPWLQAARDVGIRVLTGCSVLGTRGRLRVSSIRIARVADRMETAETVACDLVLMSGGFTPTVHLFSQSRGKLEWSELLECFVPGRAVERVRSAGACAGVPGLAAAIADGTAAGAAAASATGFHGSVPTAPAVEAVDACEGQSVGALPQPAGARSGKAFVDWQNDVTSADLALALREGFRSVEHIKRYTTTGMATDQGKTSNMNALAIVAHARETTIPQVGLTTFRMPYTPVTFGSLAGYSRRDLFDPVRRTPIDGWAREQGAEFEDVGLWKRARYFPRAGENMDAAVARECRAVRTACGIFDASTLGKIELVGPDAAEFLERFYVNSWRNLAVGRARYGILLREDGFIYDDGVIARLAPDRFHVTTTTGGAAGVLAMMEDYLQTEWPGLRVWATSTTEQWAVIAVQGPRARDLLTGLVSGLDISASALPHMGVGYGHICGVPMRLFRVSFTGELGFEVNVPADFGRAVWEAIHAAGARFGVTAYGTETMHVLRAEKGYIIIGQETDGTVTPADAGLAWAIGKNKTDFVGKRSLRRPALVAPGRRQLVGLLTEDPSVVLEEGAQLVPNQGDRPPTRSIGHITSSYHSATIGRSIALALVEGGRDRIGQTLYVPMIEGNIAVLTTSPVFYDPKSERLDG